MADVGEKIIGIRGKKSISGVAVSAQNALRNVRHLSQPQSRFLEQIPDESMGVDGDIVYYRNKVNFDKVEQYLKSEGQWINLSEGRPVNDSRKVRKFVKAKAV